MHIRMTQVAENQQRTSGWRSLSRRVYQSVDVRLNAQYRPSENGVYDIKIRKTSMSAQGISEA